MQNMIPLQPQQRPAYDLASALLQDAMSPRPIRTHLEGLGQLAKAASGAAMQSRLAGDAGENAQRLAEMIAGGNLSDPALMGEVGSLFGPEAAMQLALSNREYDFGVQQAEREAMEPDTEIGRLYAEMDTLAPDDPRRQAYTDRINVLSTRPPGTSVTVNMPPMESAFNEAYGREQGQMLAEMVANANGAAQGLVVLDQMEQILGMTAQDYFEPAKAELAAIAQGFGMDPTELGLDGPANAQTMAAAVAQLTLAQADAMSGVLSDRDMAFLQSSVPQLGNDPQANAQILANLRERLNATIDRAADAERYAFENGTLQGWAGVVPRGQEQTEPSPPPQVYDGPGYSNTGEMIPPPPPPDAPPAEAPAGPTEADIRAIPLPELGSIPESDLMNLDDGTLEYLLAPGVMQYLTDRQIEVIWETLE